MKKIAPIVLCCLLAACTKGADGTAKPAGERATPVTVAAPQVREVDLVLRALGSVESIQHPTIAAETSGRILSLDASDGDAVKAGQVLAGIDDTLHRIETAKAAAELQRQDALVENQSRVVARLQRLATTQAVAREQLEDQEAQLKVLQGQREVAGKAWEQARYTESRTVVLAPLDGVVARRHISVGDYVTVGQPLFELVAIDTLQARLAFPEQDASLIEPGKEVVLSSPAAPATPATGKVTSVNPQVALDNRAVEVIVEFANPGGWLPGSSVDATLRVKSRPGALTVPRLSVARRKGGNVVFVLDGDVARERPVELGWDEADWVEVVSGIAAGDQVIVEGVGLITDGSRVVVREPPA